jgi:hypothetical protein
VAGQRRTIYRKLTPATVNRRGRPASAEPATPDLRARRASSEWGCRSAQSAGRTARPGRRRTSGSPAGPAGSRPPAQAAPLTPAITTSLMKAAMLDPSAWINSRASRPPRPGSPDIPVIPGTARARRGPGEQLGQLAGMGGRQMRNEEVGETGITLESPDQTGERFDPAGRGADAHDSRGRSRRGRRNLRVGCHATRRRGSAEASFRKIPHAAGMTRVTRLTVRPAPPRAHW